MWRYGIAVVCIVLRNFLLPVLAVDRQLEIDEPVLLPTMDLDPTATSSVEPTLLMGNLGSLLPTISDENLEQLVDLTAEVTLKDDKALHSAQNALNDNNNNIPSILPESGEGYRALGQARSLAVLKPEQSTRNLENTTVSNTNQTNNSSAGRTSNPDIQDIISGFVKLLNTNVQATQAARPLRTRINNRGPPRITDLVLPPPTRPPYLFQRPPPPPPPPMLQPVADIPGIRPYVAGVPLPEQIVPRPGPVPATTFSPPAFTTPLTRPTFTVVSEPSVTLVNVTSGLRINATSVLIDITSESQTVNVTELVNYVETKINRTRTEPFNSKTQEVKIVDNRTTIPIKSSLITDFKYHGTVLPSIKVSTTTAYSISSSTSSQSSALSALTSSYTTASSSSIIPSLSSASSTPSPLSSSSSLVSHIRPSAIINNMVHKTETHISPQKIDASPSLNLSTSGVVAAKIESSMQEIPTEIHHKPTRWQSSTVQTDQTYYPRPGIVLDDPEYKPGGIGKPHKPLHSHQHHRTPSIGDIFDVTVSAVQIDGQPQTAQTGQPFIYPVEVDGVSVITTAEAGQHFVSIDGKRTYINLQGGPVNNGGNNEKTGVGHVLATTERLPLNPHRKTVPGRPYYHRPTHPPVRIDTCIVGDDSTCDAIQHEHCRTEFGVSSCQCRPGYSRRRHREPCHRIMSLVLALRIDRLYEHRVVWSDKLLDRDSHEFLQIEYEASRAIDSALSMTPYSDELVGSKVNNIFRGSGGSNGVYVNLTVQLEDTPHNAKRSEESLMQDMHHQLVAAIHRRGNNIGNSGLWVDSPPGSVSPVYDLDECSSAELHDCHMYAVCRNVFGSFRCVCQEGLRDPMASDELRSGRHCEACPPDTCGHRGHCYYEANTGQPVCKCLGNFYGAQCQIDGEVLGVAIGASLLAVLIIAGTLACLCVWSRKWSREDDGVTQYPPYTLRGLKVPRYGVCLDERLRWAQMADATNHYAPEPVCRGPPPICTPTQLYGRAPPPPGPLSSSEEDLHLLGGGAFHVPRPKSTSNESAIYWTAEYSHHTGPRMVTAQF